MRGVTEIPKPPFVRVVKKLELDSSVITEIQIRPRSVVSCEGKYEDGENDQIDDRNGSLTSSHVGCDNNQRRTV